MVEKVNCTLFIYERWSFLFKDCNMNSLLYSAIKKSVSGRLIVFIVQFLFMAIYARLFTPGQFGILASIQVFVIFFQMIAEIGIGPAIINENKFGPNKRDGIFTVTAIMGLILATLFFFFSYALNIFYSGYEYQKMAVFICITIFFSTLNIIPTTALNKDVQFIYIAIVDVCAECFSLCIVYILYIQGFGLFALVARSTVQSISKFLLMWFLSLKTEMGRPLFGKELYHIKSIIGFSIYQFGFNFINYFSRNLDNIIVAKYFGMISIGIYEKSYQLMRYPLMITTFAMTPAIQPILTKLRGDKKFIIKEHNRLTGRLLAISLPISVFMYINSNNIVLILFGEQWLAIEPLIKIFSIIIPIQSVLSTSGSFFQVMNKPNLLFISGVISAILNVTAIIIGLNLGEMNFIASMLVVSFILNFFISYNILFKYCFFSSSKGFYINLIKVIGVISPPIILYYIFNNALLLNFKFTLLLDLFVNFLLGIISIAFFYRPIKKLLS